MYTCNPAKEAADIWKLVWEKVQDIREEGLTVYKVKAHLKQEAMSQGRISRWDWL